jgi:hypothetical protein
MTHDPNRTMQEALQISHEELLLLLALARLPMPLALGANPAEGYTQATLGVVLAGASTSLAARGLLVPNSRPEVAPALSPGIAPLLADSALAERALLVAVRQGAGAQAVVYTLRGDAVVVHSQPFARVHRLERLPNVEIIVDHVMRQIVPHVPAGAPLDFVVDASALNLAVESVEGGEPGTAPAVLRAAGLPARLVDLFTRRLGSAVARYALAAFYDLQRKPPISSGSMVLQGAVETWYVQETGEDRVRVYTVDPDGLRGKIFQIVAQLKQRPPADAGPPTPDAVPLS